MRIEPGYNTDQPIRERGWTHWHHLLNPRQLLSLGTDDAARYEPITGCNFLKCARFFQQVQRMGNNGSPYVKGWFWKASRWREQQHKARLLQPGTEHVSKLWMSIDRRFVCRAQAKTSNNIPFARTATVDCIPASDLSIENDIYVTDPPYGDAVNYEEILEFFIAWLRKNPPPEFADWVWDSRRSLAIKGEGEEFRRGMVAAYKRMTERMPDNGIQVIMFTHQSGRLGGHGQHRMGVRSAGHRCLVRRH